MIPFPKSFSHTHPYFAEFCRVGESGAGFGNQMHSLLVVDCSEGESVNQTCTRLGSKYDGVNDTKNTDSMQEGGITECC